MTGDESKAIRSAVKALSLLLGPEHVDLGERQVVANGIGSRLVKPGKDVEPLPPHESVRQPTALNIAADDLERLYSYCQRRFIEDCHTDPSLLALALAQAAVLEVNMAPPRRVEVDGTSLRGRVAKLLHDGWFNEARSVGGTRTQLAKTGTDPGNPSLAVVFNEFKKDGFLVEEQSKFTKSPTMRVILNKHVEAA